MLYIIQNHPEVPAGIFSACLQQGSVPFAVIRPDRGEALPDPATVRAAIVLGGYMGVHDETEHSFLRPLKRFMGELVVAEIPLFGVCLGGQLLAEITGGAVTSRHRGEQGVQPIELTEAGRHDPLFAGISERIDVFEWHNDSFDPPAGAVQLARSIRCPPQAFRVGRAWGVQFHPEVDGAMVATWSATSPQHAEYCREFAAVAVEHRALGEQLLHNFLHQT